MTILKNSKIDLRIFGVCYMHNMLTYCVLLGLKWLLPLCWLQRRLLLVEAADRTKTNMMLDMLFKKILTFGYELFSILWIIAEVLDTFVYTLEIGIEVVVLNFAGRRRLRQNLGRTGRHGVEEVLNLVDRRRWWW